MVLAHSLRAQSVVAGRPIWRQEHEAAAGHMVPTVKKLRVWNVCSSSLSSFYLVQDPSPWDGAPHTRGGSFHVN